MTSAGTNAHFVTEPAGPGGGTAMCVTYFDYGSWTQCGWATATTLGILQAPKRDASPAQLDAIMIKMRPDLERLRG